MFASWFSQWVKGQSRGSRRRPSKVGPKRSCRPQVETLETRCLMSTLHTLAYNEITSLSADPDSGLGLSPRLSADGSRAVFSNITYTPYINHVFVINADGTGQREVDSFPGGHWFQEDISADGSQVISVQGLGDGYHIRMVSADGTGEHDVITIAGGYIQDRLSSDGSKVFFTDQYDFSVGTENLTKGLYVVNADGSGRRQIVSGYDIGNLLVIPPEYIDNPSVFAVSASGPSLAMTTDSQQIVFGVRLAADVPDGARMGQYLLGVNSNGSDLHLIKFLPSPFNFDHAGISGDGSTVFYDFASTSGLPFQVAVNNFDGTLETVVSDHPFPNGYLGSDDPLQISEDGSQLLMGSSGVRIDTTSGKALQLAARGWSSLDPADLVMDTMYRATMNSTATRFLYIAGYRNGALQLATLDLDPADLGAAPRLDNFSINPPAIAADGGVTTATVSATVGTPYSLLRVGYVVLNDGLFDNSVTSDVMLDVGQSSVYSNNRVSAGTNAVPGPRTVRVTAEVNELADRSGLRHATAVEFDPFWVDPAPAPPPPASGGRHGPSTVGAALLGVPQTGQSGATNRPVEMTGNQVQPIDMAQPSEEEWALLLAGSLADSRKAPGEDADAVWTALANEEWARMADPFGAPAFDLAPVVSLDFGK
jgi:hypothetical protein